MNRQTHAKSGLFLMEIMFNILFFSVLVTFCLQMFFRAHSLSEETSALHCAVTTCSSLAEIYQSSKNGKETLTQDFPEFSFADNTLEIYFNDEFRNCPKEKATYFAEIVFLMDDRKTAEISFYRLSDSDKIYSLPVSGYCPQTVNTLSGGERP